MPQLGETVTEGTIIRWYKAVGDPVAVDDVLFEVSTEKVDTEVPSAVAGVLRAVHVAEGETVPVGTALAVITATADEPMDEPVAPVAAAPAAPDRDTTVAAESPRGRHGAQRAQARARRVPVAGGAGAHGRARPLARRRRRQRAGRSHHPERRPGRRREPIGRAGRRRPPPPTAPPPHAEVPRAGPDDDVVEFTKARRATAEHMVRSLATSAHTLVATEVDYHHVDPVRRRAGLSYLPFVARATIDALREHPHLNASVGDDELIVHRRINLGLAVDVGFEALVVPVVKDAGGLRLGALAEAMAAQADKARSKRLTGDDLSGGTFTITNVGAYGTVVTAPVINQPQVAILSTDGVRMRPTAVRSEAGEWVVAVHPLGNLSLSFDHRAVDGAYAAAFLALVRELLETRDWQQEL